MKKDIKIADFETFKLDSIHAGNYCEMELNGCILKEMNDVEPGNVKMYRLYNDTNSTTETVKVCSLCENEIIHKLNELQQ